MNAFMILCLTWRLSPEKSLDELLACLNRFCGPWKPDVFIPNRNSTLSKGGGTMMSWEETENIFFPLGRRFFPLFPGFGTGGFPSWEIGVGKSFGSPLHLGENLEVVSLKLGGGFLLFKSYLFPRGTFGKTNLGVYQPLKGWETTVTNAEGVSQRGVTDRGRNVTD